MVDEDWGGFWGYCKKEMEFERGELESIVRCIEA
jgi:hypothetical protein